LEKFIQIIQEKFQNLTTEQKRRLALAGTIVVAAILTIFVLMSMGNGCDREEVRGAPERLSIIAPIPAEDLFIPDEPDFIPGVLLERDRRTSWTEQDALEHWQDPLRFGEGQWRENIETAIDNLLERVP
jgi:hypothetical protein